MVIAQGSHHHGLIITSKGIEQPDIEEAPRGGCQPGLLSWVLVWRGTDPPRRYRITTSRPRYGDTVGNR